MTTYGDFQSIFQLVAGLTLGVSGLVTLFEDPIEREARRFSRLAKRLKRLPDRHEALIPPLSVRIQALTESVEDKEENLSIESDVDDRFRLIKFSSFVVSVFGLWLLIYSSDRSAEPLPLCIKIISIGMLAYVPISIVLIAWELRRIGLPFSSKRKEYEKSYFDIVKDIWKTKEVGDHEVSGVGQPEN